MKKVMVAIERMEEAAGLTTAAVALAGMPSWTWSTSPTSRPVAGLARPARPSWRARLRAVSRADRRTAPGTIGR